jgi:hypothetical protein
MKNKKQLTVTISESVLEALEKEIDRIQKDSGLEVSPNQLAASWLVHYGIKLGYKCSSK